MFSKLTIGKKIGLGFGILIILTLLVFLRTNETVVESKEINKRILNVNNPSIEALEDMNLLIVKSNLLITNWVFIPSADAGKVKLKELIEKDYPALKEKINRISNYWPERDQKIMDTIFNEAELLFKEHRRIMSELSSMEAYNDQITIMMNQISVTDGDVKTQTNLILDHLGEVIEHQHKNTSVVSNNMTESMNVLQNVVRYLGILLVVGGIVIATFTVRTIVKPVKSLQEVILILAKGKFPDKPVKEGNDEIGEMAKATNTLVDAFSRTTDFSREIGAGNFEMNYQPLSEEDVLGHTLLKMRDELKESEAILEAKVKERTAEVMRQRDEIQDKNKTLEELYGKVTDSIRYAKRIQNSILPPNQLVKKHFKDSFIFYRPKDIVSGDFYWFARKGNCSIIAAVDCTGHGVPGAFMSIVGYNALNSIIQTNDDPDAATILDQLNHRVSSMLRQTTDGENSKDGMDLALCKIDHEKRTLQYSGAYNPLYYLRKEKLYQVKADKFPIGLFIEEEKKKFTNKEVKVEEGDVFYIFSDGYADQFGGPRGKKFMYKRFREMLIANHKKPFHEQEDILNSTLKDWMGEDNEQLDDILVIGFKI